MDGRRSVGPLLLLCLFAGSARAQTIISADRGGLWAPFEPIPRPTWKWHEESPIPPWGYPFVVGAESASKERMNHQVPGWREGVLAANEQSVAPQRILGFVGGAAIGVSLNFFVYEPVSEHQEMLATAALGAGLVLFPALTRPPAPDAALMQEITAFGPDSRSAFVNGYLSQLKRRRTRASLWSGLVGVLSAFLGIELLCLAGGCN